MEKVEQLARRVRSNVPEAVEMVSFFGIEDSKDEQDQTKKVPSGAGGTESKRVKKKSQY